MQCPLLHLPLSLSSVLEAISVTDIMTAFDSRPGQLAINSFLYYCALTGSEAHPTSCSAPGTVPLEIKWPEIEVHLRNLVPRLRIPDVLHALL